MIFGLFITLTIILIICFIVFNRDLCAPAFLLTVGFWFSSLWAWLYQDNWNGFENRKLYILIAGSVFAFCIACFITNLFDKAILTKSKDIKLEPIIIPLYKLKLYLLIEIIMFLLVMLVVFMNTSSRNIITAIGEYYVANKYNRLIYESGVVKIIQYFNIAGVYIIGYVILNNIICKIKNSKITYIIVIFGMIISVLQGTRNNLFMLIISGIIMYYILKGVNNGWKPNITLKTFLKMITTILILILFFKMSIVFTGRNSDEYTFIEMLSTYIGSPLKNLELFINENYYVNNIFGEQTLLQTYKKIYEFTGNINYNVTSLYQYRWIGSIGLGNVYTMLMPLYNDFGLYGSWILMALIGFISQKQYDHIRCIKRINVISKQILIYSYVSFAIMFSFFSNKYFEMVVSTAFIYTFIGIEVIIKFIWNVTFSQGKLIIKKRRMGICKN